MKTPSKQDLYQALDDLILSVMMRAGEPSSAKRKRLIKSGLLDPALSILVQGRQAREWRNGTVSVWDAAMMQGLVENEKPKSKPKKKRRLLPTDIIVHSSEDEMVTFHKDGKYYDTFYARDPEQARDFVQAFKEIVFHTEQELFAAWDGFIAGWKSKYSDQDEY